MFQPGDVVQLKSGGPVMTVRWCQDEYGSVDAYCDWFVGTKQEGAKFAAAQLQKTEAGPRGV